MKALLKDVLSRAAADYIEIRLEDTLGTAINFTGKELEECSQNVDFGGNVRALVKGGWGFTTFNSLDDLAAKVELAISHARSIGERRGENLKLAEVPVVETEIPFSAVNDPSAVPLEDKLSVIRGYNEQVLSFVPRVTTSSTRYHDKRRKVIFANSEGTYISREFCDLAISVGAIVRTPKGAFSGRAYNGSSNDYSKILGLEEDIVKSCERAIAIAEAEPVSGGCYTVILNPTLAGVFIHEAFGHLSEGDNVYEDPNLQKVMVLGREFGPSNLNVVDTGLDVGTRGYLPYDDEGVKTERTYLIRDGRLVGRLHSRETAAKMGERPTGNARAINFRFPPIPRMRNTCIEPGDVSFDEMIKATDKGIYCLDASGGQTNGELFTFTAGDAFLIENGEITKRVRDVTLSGNVFETLKNIDMIGNDYYLRDSGGGCGKGGQMPLPVSHASPHIRIRNVVVGGK
ncbi:MAG: TldD/PmbA family protein [Planctomycetota bacterium]